MAGMYPDNQELDIFGEKVQWPGVDSSGKFSNGSFQNSLEKPSFIPAETINLILDNLSELIKKLGGTPDNTSIDQLAKLFTIAATANTGIMRDASGRAKVAAPKADDDIARKKEIDDILNGVVALKRLTVEGDIIQKGANKITHAENVYTKKDMIYLREGAVTALANNALAGLIANLYDGAKNGVLAFDKIGTARVGDEGDTQPLATRAESSEMRDGAVVCWNGGKQRLETQRELATFGICTTQTNTMNKTVAINGFVRQAGAHFYVKFNNDGGGTRNVYNLTLNVHNGNNYTGAAPVYVGKFQCGIGAISAGCTYEILFDGEHYVILNSDIVAQEIGKDASYIKKGNGLIKQWGRFYAAALRATLTMPIAFNSWNSYTVVTGEAAYYNNLNDTEGFDLCAGINKRTDKTIEFSIAESTREIHWFTIGS